jgi:hypothetical protein
MMNLVVFLLDHPVFGGHMAIFSRSDSPMGCPAALTSTHPNFILTKHQKNIVLLLY